MKVNLKVSYRKIFIKNIIGGLGWAAGITLGFTFISAFLGLIVNRLGGLPVVGDFFASIIKATQKALQSGAR